MKPLPMLLAALVILPACAGVEEAPPGLVGEAPVPEVSESAGAADAEPREESFDVMEWTELMETLKATPPNAEGVPALVARCDRVLGGTANPSLRAMLHLCIAGLHYRREEWDEALGRLDLAKAEYARIRNPDAEDEEMVDLMAVLRAEVLRRLGRTHEAEAAEEQAKDRLLDRHGSGREGWGEWADRIAERASGPFSMPWGYGGKYVGDPRLDAGVARLREAWPAALERVRRKLGNPRLEPPPVVLVIVDGEKIERGTSMMTLEARAKSHPLGVVVAAAEDRVTGVADEVLCLAHELAHVLHRTGGGLVEGTPDWLSEGLAHWLEAEDEEPLKKRALAWAINLKEEDQVRISAVLASERSLAEAPENAQRVAGAVVFFQLGRILGESGMRELVLRLLADPDWGSALRDATGREWPEVLPDLRRGYLEWTRKSFEGQEVLVAAGRVGQEQGLAAGLEIIDRFLAGNAAGPMKDIATLQRIQILRAMERHEDVIAACRGFRADRADHPSADFAIALGAEFDALCALERWEEAVPLGRTLVRDYLWDDPEARERAGESLEQAEAGLRKKEAAFREPTPAGEE